ncbi:MAG: class I SAM-dependent methyltransferase [Wenzhouxiangella sp.]|jgi:SAM-dependent methyltransferase|nr:class I SAM-dependent methyltransferase [Wenzhouxiangella sp.]
MEKTSDCPVCEHAGAELFVTVDERHYLRCTRCLATFLDPAQRPGRARERQEYDRHRNNIDDPAYRRFLAPALEAVQRNVKAGGSVLDYGCGPGPALGQMLIENGYSVSLYDPIYRPDQAPLHVRYDAITCTEVAEHFHDPAREFRRLNALLGRGGWLIIMTRFQTDDARFARWHYRRDPTHVVFYRAETFMHLARLHTWRVNVTPPHLVELQTL